MSSLNGTNRQVTLVNQTQLEQMFPGMPPNTQIRISGPLLPSRLFQEEESFELHSHDPLSDSPVLRYAAPRIIDASLSERKSEHIHVLDRPEPSPHYSISDIANLPQEEHKKLPEFVSPIVKSPTRDLSEEEYVQKISNMSQLILGADSQSWAKVCGPNIEIVSEGRNGTKSFSLKNNFEVNGIIITRISVTHGLEESKSVWSITLTYIKHPKEYFTDNRYHLQYIDKDLQTAVRKSYMGLKALRRCTFCTSIWNSQLSDVCVTCLFNDYFTRENEVYDCPVCKESIRDWTILNCNHRVCYKCLAQIRKPRKCPMCRHEID